MNLLLRVLVALIFIPVIIVSIVKGGYFIDAFLSTIAIGAIYEYKKIVGKDVSPCTVLLFVISIAISLIIKENSYLFSLVFAALPLGFRHAVKNGEENFNGNLKMVSLNVLPFIYILVPLMLFSDLYSSTQFKGILPHVGIFMLMNIWLNDSFAYFTGMLFGKSRLAPKISPKKSIEGFVGGLVFAVIGSVVYYFNFSFMAVQHIVILSIIISLSGPIGDLFESVIKREYGVKDSSNLIPGHGGVLDRFDSFLFTIPFYYAYIKLFI